MKIAVSASSPSLDGDIDPRFGRCPYFLIVDTGTLSFEALANPHLAASGGAGIQAAQLVASKGAEAVLTGSCGPNASQTLNAAHIEIVTGLSGPIRNAVRGFRPGAGANTGQAPDAPPRVAGRGDPGNPSRGSGGGGGMGMGRGKGRGCRGGSSGFGRG
jgi:predicted Fe-Mo cluster-binding NifX family protein